MSPRTASLWLFLVGACGCGGTAPDVGGGQDARFVGRWFVEETVAHALYGASTYAFAQDGTIELVWDAGLYGLPQGYVRNADWSAQCFFGETWRSEGGDLLIIDGECDDGTPREIVLHFTNDPGQNAAGATVHIESVGGQGGWLPPQWGWSFRKCSDDEPCTGWQP